MWCWCAAHGKRLIYASSAATYGAGEHGFDDDGSLEALAKLRPLNAYGWSKHLFDRWVARELAEGRPSPPQWVGLKFFNVYGPNEYHKGGMQSVVAQKYPLAVAGEPITLFRSHRPDVPDGGQKRRLRVCQRLRRRGALAAGSSHRRTDFSISAPDRRAASTTWPAPYSPPLKRPADMQYIDMPAAIRPNYQYFTEASMERLRKRGLHAARSPRSPTACGDYVGRYLSQPDRYR